MNFRFLMSRKLSHVYIYTSYRFLSSSRDRKSISRDLDNHKLISPFSPSHQQFSTIRKRVLDCVKVEGLLKNADWRKLLQIAQRGNFPKEPMQCTRGCMLASLNDHAPKKVLDKSVQSLKTYSEKTLYGLIVNRTERLYQNKTSLMQVLAYLDRCIQEKLVIWSFESVLRRLLCRNSDKQVELHLRRRYYTKHLPQLESLCLREDVSWKQALTTWQLYSNNQIPSPKLCIRLLKDDIPMNYTKRISKILKLQDNAEPLKQAIQVDGRKICELLQIDETFYTLLPRLGYFLQGPFPIQWDEHCGVQIMWTDRLLMEVWRRFIKLTDQPISSQTDITSNEMLLHQHLDQHLIQGTVTRFINSYILDYKTLSRIEQSSSKWILTTLLEWLENTKHKTAYIRQFEIHLHLLCCQKGISVPPLSTHCPPLQVDSVFLKAICEAFYFTSDLPTKYDKLLTVICKAFTDIYSYEDFDLLVLTNTPPYGIDVDEDVLKRTVSKLARRRYPTATLQFLRNFQVSLTQDQISMCIAIIIPYSACALAFAESLSELTPTLKASEYCALSCSIIRNPHVDICRVLISLRNLIQHMEKGWFVFSPAHFQRVTESINIRSSTEICKDPEYVEVVYLLMCLYLRTKRVHKWIPWSSHFLLAVKGFPDSAFRKAVIAGLWSDYMLSDRKAEARFPKIIKGIIEPANKRRKTYNETDAVRLTGVAIRHIFNKTNDVVFAHFACFSYGISSAVLLPFVKAEERERQRKKSSEIVFSLNERKASCESFLNEFRAAQLTGIHFHRLHFYKLILQATKLSVALRSIASLVSAGYNLKAQEVSHVLRLPTRLGWKNAMKLLDTLSMREQCEVGRSNALAYHFLPSSHEKWESSDYVIRIRDLDLQDISMKHRKALKRRDAEESTNSYMRVSNMRWDAACAAFHQHVELSPNICGTNALNQLVIMCILQGGKVTSVFEICSHYAQQRKIYLYPSTIEYILRHSFLIESSLVHTIEDYLRTYHYKSYIYDPQIPHQIGSWISEVCSGKPRRSNPAEDFEDALSPIHREHAISIAHQVSWKMGMNFAVHQSSVNNDIGNLLGALCQRNYPGKELLNTISIKHKDNFTLLALLGVSKEKLNQSLYSSLGSTRWEQAVAMIHERCKSGMFQVDGYIFDVNPETVSKTALLIHLLWSWTETGNQELSTRPECYKTHITRSFLQTCLSITALTQIPEIKVGEFLVQLLQTSPYPASSIEFVRLLAEEKSFVLSSEIFRALREVNSSAALEIIHANARIDTRHRLRGIDLLYKNRLFVEVLLLADSLSLELPPKSNHYYQSIYQACHHAIPKTCSTAWSTFTNRTKKSQHIFSSYMCIEARTDANFAKCVSLLEAASRSQIPMKAYHESARRLSQRLNNEENWKAALLFLKSSLFNNEYFSSCLLEAAVFALRKKHLFEEAMDALIALQKKSIHGAEITSLIRKLSDCMPASIGNHTAVIAPKRQTVGISDQDAPSVKVHAFLSHRQYTVTRLFRCVDPFTLSVFLERLQKDNIGRAAIASSVAFFSCKARSYIGGHVFAQSGCERSQKKCLPKVLQFAIKIIFITKKVTSAFDNSIARRRKYSQDRQSLCSYFFNKELDFSSQWQMYLSLIGTLDEEYHTRNLIDYTLESLYYSSKGALIPRFLMSLNPVNRKCISSNSMKLALFGCEMLSKYDVRQSIGAYEKALSTYSICMENDFSKAGSTISTSSTWLHGIQALTNHIHYESDQIDFRHYVSILTQKPPAEVADRILENPRSEGHVHNFVVIRTLTENVSADLRYKVLALKLLGTTLERREPYEPNIVRHAYKIMRSV
ncbi:hypothetical protein XU18_0267 [Perkinsela sp. CCAP 1560/4]|nr:hypothetical protein XU18_0267 [Perkinsela sp. CCAP 1560/4]|eukprot:KNH09582.1 hypothetical protein XU18_0267 [Perkinsela sp. CCAP 1560/4]